MAKWLHLSCIDVVVNSQDEDDARAKRPRNKFIDDMAAVNSDDEEEEEVSFAGPFFVAWLLPQPYLEAMLQQPKDT